MSSLEATCEALVETIDAAVACGVLDLDSGHLLAMSRTKGLSPDTDDVFASAVADIFFNASVAKTDDAVRSIVSGRPPVGTSSAQEILITTAHSYQFARRLGASRFIILLVTGQEANVGLAWAQLRAAVPGLQTCLESMRAAQHEQHPVRALISHIQEAAPGSEGTFICGQLQQPAGLVLLDEGQVSWVTARAMKQRLAQYFSQNARRPIPVAELRELSEASRREGRTLGESLLAAGVLDEEGLRRSYLAHCASALIILSQDAAARPLTWRAGALSQRQSPFRFSAEELLAEALAAAH